MVNTKQPLNKKKKVFCGWPWDFVYAKLVGATAQGFATFKKINTKNIYFIIIKGLDV